MDLNLKNNLCLLNLKIQETKINLHKKCCSFCHRTNHSISACFKKQRDDEDKRDAYARSKSPQKSFVQYFRSPSNDRTKRYDTRYRSRSTLATILTIKTIHKTDTVLHLEIDLDMIKILLLHNTLDHDMILTNAIHDPIAPHIDLHIDLLIDLTLARDIDHALIQEKTTFQTIRILTDHLPDQDILDFLDHAHIPILETNSTWYNHKTPLN